MRELSSITVVVVSLIVSVTVWAEPGQPNVFLSHEDELDLPCVRSVYPFVSGSVLDSCTLCHRGGEVEAKELNGCDYCHQTYQKLGYKQTVNSYGRAFLQSGRSENALRAIENQDSDGDGKTNLEELKAMTNPGENNSRPQVPDAPTKIFDSAALAAIPTHQQFLLLNASKSQDLYGFFSGYAVLDILLAAGVDRETFTSITVVAADGYQKDFTRDEVVNDYPAGIFYGPTTLPAKTETCSELVDYPQMLPASIVDGQPIPGALKLMLAVSHDGVPLTPASRKETGHLSGQGPFRIIQPQKVASPPDQNRKKNEPNCPNPYDESIHHNAGDCVRSVIAIKVHPMPNDTKEPDWAKLIEEFIREKKFMVFGQLPATKTEESLAPESK